ncbi:MAG: Crp/Fnr family transcriptional regulator [Aestuariivita sp.]|nr:Crp/Fnr family transcriptional regulator [Aestuariivita sp.]
MKLRHKYSQDCSDCPIRYRAICSHCEVSELERLESMKFYRVYERGQTIMWTGDKMEFVGSVVSGIATLSQTMEDGRRQMVGLLLPSDFVGRPGRENIGFDVVATTDLVLCCFWKKPFEDMMAETPHILQRLLEMSLDELDAAREWMLVLGRKTAREKIASLMLVLAQRKSALTLTTDARDIAFELPLTREAMADYLGLTLETVSRQISSLRKDSVIFMNSKRSITVPDMGRLFEEAGNRCETEFMN